MYLHLGSKYVFSKFLKLYKRGVDFKLFKACSTYDFTLVQICYF